jgi:heavy metal translocating P-type ATPase
LLEKPLQPTDNDQVMTALRYARQYPLLAATFAVAIIAGILTAVAPASVPWVLGIYSGAIAARALWHMIRELIKGSFGLDILAVTAIGATIAVGEYWASLVIVLMVVTGEALEDYAAGRAQRDLTALVSGAPRIAHVESNGTITDVEVDAVEVGATILVRAHEMVPVDGALISEVGTFDESSLTGESVPKELAAGDLVLSGSINGAGAATIRVTRPASESQYQQIVSLVEEAANSRSPMVRMADKYAIPFTVLSLGIAAAAWIFSGDASRFAQVLVVATPCPLLIATPVAFMGGMSRAARRGIIVRTSAALEQLHSAKSFGFDKTGTLTHGRPQLLAATPATTAVDSDTLLHLAASAEQGSAHVLAEALVAGAGSRELKLVAPSDVVETTAGGITATVDGRAVVVGKYAFVAEKLGATIPTEALQPGELAIYVGVDGEYAGTLTMRDQVRSDAAATVAALREQGVEDIAMFTGDAEATARHIAGSIGIEDVHAGLLPADKVAGVKSLPHHPVVMVGDGVNDAPVLAAADVGIAMAARGATAASESADVVILHDSISRVAEAHAIGRYTVKVAIQAIWIGIIISVALMLFATTGMLPAFVGAWLQEVVDVIAILWALRAATGGVRAIRARRRISAPSIPAAVAPVAA